MAWITVCVAGLASGLVVEHLAVGWGSPLRWLPDLAVGLTLIGAGAIAARRSAGVGVLLAVAGFAWFAGTLSPLAVYWHRGPLIQVLATYPGARPASRTAWVVVFGGYASALTAPLWSQDGSGVALALIGVGLAAVSHRRASGRRRHDRRIALEVVAVFAVVIVARGGGAAGGTGRGRGFRALAGVRRGADRCRCPVGCRTSPAGRRAGRRPGRRARRGSVRGAACGARRRPAGSDRAIRVLGAGQVGLRGRLRSCCSRNRSRATVGR